MASKLGRLKSVGIEELWQVPLYCPVIFEDNSHVWGGLHPEQMPLGQTALFKVSLFNSPVIEWKNKKPHTKFTVTDGQYNTMFTLFGDTRKLVETLNEKQTFYVSGVPTVFNGKIYLNEAKIVPDESVGSIIPVYPGKAGKITPENVRVNINKHLDIAIPLASIEIRKKLIKHFKSTQSLRQYLQCQSMTLETILFQLHKPDSLSMAYTALSIMTKIANVVAADTLLSRATEENIVTVPALFGADYRALVEKIPFELTQEQSDIVNESIATIRKGEMLNGLISGDVGTGKTAVYAVIAAYIASAGGRVAVLLPNSNLAAQIYEEIASYYDHFGFGVGVITGGREVNPDAAIVIGTTALLHRDMGKMDLVVCDEQQKMATGQREQLRGEHTHLIEVSATPIPRTMALAIYGAVKIFKITKCHAQKTIHTKIWHKTDNAVMMKGVMDTVRSGKKVLIVCPKRETKDDEEEGGLVSAQDLARKFERFAPNRIVLSHAQLSTEQNEQAIKAIKGGDADILISTTTVEVGITIPNLERVVVVHAERFGLQVLHQIRGRVVRHGGVGFCDLYLPKEIKNPDSMIRLQLLEQISDGFELAHQDMRLRGIGDITANGTTQHGSVDVMIKNIKCNIDDIDATVEDILARREAA
jgi:ATP-dependent DNA helicase RecG